MLSRVVGFSASSLLGLRVKASFEHLMFGFKMAHGVPAF
jgi:hypothetical protein